MGSRARILCRAVDGHGGVACRLVSMEHSVVEEIDVSDRQIVLCIDLKLSKSVRELRCSTSSPAPLSSAFT